MRHRSPRALATLICTFAAFALLPSAGSAAVVGIGESSPSMFSDPAFAQLKVHEARLLVPWDVATARSERPTLATDTAWLKAARASRVTPLVSFGGIGNYIPSVGKYTSAVRAFLHRFPTVKRYAAWNEPDWPYRSISRHPRLAASFFNALHRQCHGCVVLAGDVFLAAKQLGPWLRSYRAGLRYRPAGWALHDYYDVRSHSTAQLRVMMSLTTGPIWLDEISGVERRGHWQYRNQSAAAAARDERFLFSLAHRLRRISRIYHYEWQGVTSAGWDSGLISPTGAKRPAYYVVKAAAR
jgi:Glycosyl hydrolase catalytic core